jgi:hypothetical protein
MSSVRGERAADGVSACVPVSSLTELARAWVLSFLVEGSWAGTGAGRGGSWRGGGDGCTGLATVAGASSSGGLDEGNGNVGGTFSEGLAIEMRHPYQKYQLILPTLPA